MRKVCVSSLVIHEVDWVLERVHLPHLHLLSVFTFGLLRLQTDSCSLYSKDACLPKLRNNQLKTWGNEGRSDLVLPCEYGAELLSQGRGSHSCAWHDTDQAWARWVTEMALRSSCCRLPAHQFYIRSASKFFSKLQLHGIDSKILLMHFKCNYGKSLSGQVTQVVPLEQISCNLKQLQLLNPNAF